MSYTFLTKNSKYVISGTDNPSVMAFTGGRDLPNGQKQFQDNLVYQPQFVVQFTDDLRNGDMAGKSLTSSAIQSVHVVDNMSERMMQNGQSPRTGYVFNTKNSKYIISQTDNPSVMTLVSETQLPTGHTQLRSGLIYPPQLIAQFTNDAKNGELAGKQITTSPIQSLQASNDVSHRVERAEQFLQNMQHGNQGFEMNYSM